MAEPVVRRILNIKGLNTYVNPLLKDDGELLKAVNVISEPYGSKSKRPGFTAYLGTADGKQVNSLFTWRKDDGTTFFNYRASGSALYYSVQGTGAWTLATNGTISNGGHVGYAVLNNTLIIGDGVGSTRHTTDGITFTDTVLAPPASQFVQYQQRIYAMGTASTLFYSTTGDATNWATSGTSDSSSFTIPGEGKLLKVFKVADTVIATKTGGNMFKWDGYTLNDLATNLGPSSPYSVDSSEGYFFWINRLGQFGYGGGNAKLLSNAVQSQIYNNMGSGVLGSIFDTAPATVHRYDWMCSLGTVTDGYTRETINNAILKYDYQKNEFLNFKFDKLPTAYNSYKNANGNQTLIFGDANGQCYTYGGTALTDNGAPIDSVIEFSTHLGIPEFEKAWERLFAYFNPGSQAHIQVAIGDSYMPDNMQWNDLGDTSTGVVEFRFQSDKSRGRFLFVRIYDSSRDSRFTFNGIVVSARPNPLW